MDQDKALAIFITYIGTEEINENDTPTPSYIPYLNEEPIETDLFLQEEEELIRALVLQPSTSAMPFAMAPL